MVSNSTHPQHLSETFDPLGEILWGADSGAPREPVAPGVAMPGLRPRNRRSAAPEAHPALLCLEALGRQYPDLPVVAALPLIMLATGTSTPRLGQFSLPRVQQS